MNSHPLLSPQLDTWRQRYSPLRGLDVARVTSLLEAGSDRGEFTELQWAVHHVIKRWPILRALRERRASALLRLEWSVKKVAQLPPGATPAQAQAQAQALRAAYDQLDNLREALRFLSLAEFTGYAHLQKHRGDGGHVFHLEPLDPWNWVRDGYRGPWYWNPAAENVTAQTLKTRPESHIDPAEFIVREVENPVYEAALPLYLYYTLALRDWAAHTEIFGIPRPVIIMPEGLHTPEEDQQFLRAADDIGNGGTGCLPFGSVTTFPGENRAPAPFQELITEVETKLVIATTGGKLSMLNEATGLGSTTARTHQDAFNEIAEAEAMEIGEVFQKQLDREILARRFPGQPVLAFFSLAARQETDVTEVVGHVRQLAAAGYEVDPAQIEELTGYSTTRKASLGPGGPEPTHPSAPERAPADGTNPNPQTQV